MNSTKSKILLVLTIACLIGCFASLIWLLFSNPKQLYMWFTVAVFMGLGILFNNLRNSCK